MENPAALADLVPLDPPSVEELRTYLTESEWLGMPDSEKLRLSKVIDNFRIMTNLDLNSTGPDVMMRKINNNEKKRVLSSERKVMPGNGDLHGASKGAQSGETSGGWPAKRTREPQTGCNIAHSLYEKPPCTDPMNLFVYNEITDTNPGTRQLEMFNRIEISGTVGVGSQCGSGDYESEHTGSGLSSDNREQVQFVSGEAQDMAAKIVVEQSDRQTKFKTVKNFKRNLLDYKVAETGDLQTHVPAMCDKIRPIKHERGSLNRNSRGMRSQNHGSALHDKVRSRQSYQ